MKQYIAYMLDRTNAMFEYENLPDTIPAYMLELYLQTFGYAAFVKIDETNSISYPQPNIATPPGVYIFFGGIGGERDIYYRPKLFTAANSRLKNSVQSTILYPGDDPGGIENPCVLMFSDRNLTGLLPLFNRYAEELVENDISIRSAQINARAQVGISVSTDRDKETARKYLDDLEAGKLGIIGETAFLDGISVANISTQSANVIIQLIELQQYLKASWFNELGLNVNFNMKREYMSEEEIAVNTDILLPLIDDMLRCRQEAVALINEVFGLNISVHKSSAWANKEFEDIAALSEAAVTGELEIPDEILERSVVDEEEIGQTAEETVLNEAEENISAGGNSVTTEQPTESDGSSVGTEPEIGEDARDNTIDEAKVVVEVNVNVGGEVDGATISEPEALEESEEPNPEPSVS